MDLRGAPPYPATVRTAAVLISALVVACGTSDPARPRVDASDASSVAVVNSGSPITNVTPSSTASVTPSAPTAKPDPLSVVSCRADVDCGWDDTCFPKRCAKAGRMSACDESSAPPGQCLCVDGGCTLKPKEAPAATGTCEVRGCMVDRAGAACIADTGGVPEGLRGSPGLDSGPSCDCIDPKKGCTFQWFDPVPCKTDRDCWISAEPRTHPVKRPAALRGRDFKPCSDGETEPKCGAQGQCVRGRAFKC